MIARWRSLPPFTQDLIAGLGFATMWFAAFNFWTNNGWYPARPETWIMVGVWTAAAITLRRLYPTVVLLTTAVVYPWLYGAPLQTEFHLIPIFIAGYGAAASGKVRWWLAFGAPLGSILLVSHLTYQVRGGMDWSEVLFYLSAVSVVVAMGILTYRQSQDARELARQNAELQRLRDVEADRAVSEERTRIARDLHDVVAHHLVALIVRGQAAKRLSERDPRAVSEAIPWMVDTAREALNSIRQTVRVLRTDDTVPLAPEPKLADLGSITRRIGEAGLDVTLQIDGVLPPLSSQVELATVRIAQEALTNTLRHSGAESVVVTVRPDPEGVLLQLEDDGTIQLEAMRAGNGVRGMEERAIACGGTLHIDIGSLGGCRVRAWLPAVAKVTAS
jgi:signal transduction histidine kinase